MVPYWECVSLADGVAITTPPGAVEFDDGTRTDRVFSRHATAGGELFIHQWTNHRPFRARIAFRVNQPFTCKARVLADGAGNWWRTVNGVTTGATGPADFDIAIGAGLNVITIEKDDTNTDRLLFEALLFDGENSVWEAPTVS